MAQKQLDAVVPGSGSVVALNGASLVAEAMRQINPDVVAAYPITPQTILMEAFSQFVADGRVDTEFVTVESEHAALSTLIGASAAGARAQSATSGAGLAFMWELLWCASGMRLPLVMHLVTRSLSAPLNILGDHTDAMGARDTGWVQIFAEDGREAYDNAIQAVRIAEHRDVLLPVMSAQDGFTVSHSVERAETLSDDAVRSFIGSYAPAHTLLDVDHPATFGPNADRVQFALYRRQQAAALEGALAVILDVGREYGARSGRSYGAFEGYRLEDAEFVAVLMGSAAGAARAAIDELRAEGMRVGLLKLRVYRPFPSALLADALQGAQGVAVLDKSAIFGSSGGPLFLDVAAALAVHRQQPALLPYVYGLGGRDTYPWHLAQVFRELQEAASLGEAAPGIRFLGLD